MPGPMEEILAQYARTGRVAGSANPMAPTNAPMLPPPSPPLPPFSAGEIFATPERDPTFAPVPEATLPPYFQEKIQQGGDIAGLLGQAGGNAAAGIMPGPEKMQQGRDIMGLLGNVGSNAAQGVKDMGRARLREDSVIAPPSQWLQNLPKLPEMYDSAQELIDEYVSPYVEASDPAKERIRKDVTDMTRQVGEGIGAGRVSEKKLLRDIEKSRRGQEQRAANAPRQHGDRPPKPNADAFIGSTKKGLRPYKTSIKAQDRLLLNQTWEDIGSAKGAGGTEPDSNEESNIVLQALSLPFQVVGLGANLLRNTLGRAIHGGTLPSERYQEGLDQQIDEEQFHADQNALQHEFQMERIRLQHGNEKFNELRSAFPRMGISNMIANQTGGSDNAKGRGKVKGEDIPERNPSLLEGLFANSRERESESISRIKRMRSENAMVRGWTDAIARMPIDEKEFTHKDLVNKLKGLQAENYQRAADDAHIRSGAMAEAYGRRGQGGYTPSQMHSANMSAWTDEGDQILGRGQFGGKDMREDEDARMATYGSAYPDRDLQHEGSWLNPFDNDRRDMPGITADWQSRRPTLGGGGGGGGGGGPPARQTGTSRLYGDMANAPELTYGEDPVLDFSSFGAFKESANNAGLDQDSARAVWEDNKKKQR